MKVIRDNKVVSIYIKFALPEIVGGVLVVLLTILAAIGCALYL
jgi:hypothetical protein